MISVEAEAQTDIMLTAHDFTKKKTFKESRYSAERVTQKVKERKRRNKASQESVQVMLRIEESLPQRP